jgi:hypothetical protein
MLSAYQQAGSLLYVNPSSKSSPRILTRLSGFRTRPKFILD